MNTQYRLGWTFLSRALLLLLLIFVLGSMGSTTQAAENLSAASNLLTLPPVDFSLEIARPGVELFKKENLGGAPDFVQVVDLSKGANIHLFYGELNSQIEAGGWDGANPRITRQDLQEVWDSFSGSNENAFCITNGQFFSTNDYPTPLAFSLKVNGNVISEGYASGGVKEEYPPPGSSNQKLMLEIWDDHVDIVELTEDNFKESSAPNILAGLSEQADKGVNVHDERTFVAIVDANNDNTYETVLIFNSLVATQTYAASTLRSFYPNVVNEIKVMMLDGGGSTQLICHDDLLVPSAENPDRKIPQTLGVSAAPHVSTSVDVALIIDSSGSMRSNDPGNKRLDAAHAYLTGSFAGDYVGVIDFDSYSRVASPLLRLPDYKDELNAAIDTINSSGGTNIGAGVGSGCNILINSSSENTVKGAILLTDGVGAFNNQDECFRVRDWPIYTFGFGGANEALLQDIAANTGGEFTWLPTTELVCEFQRVRAKIAGVEPGPCEVFHIGPLEITRFTIIVDPGQEQVTYSISWVGSDVELSLVSPSGRVIDRSTTDPDVIHDLGETFEIYTILNPEPGEWEVSIFGADVPTGGEEVVFGFTNIPSANQPPVLSVPESPFVQYSDPLTFDVSATDPDEAGEALVLSVIDLPDFLSFTDNQNGTATITGFATTGPGIHNVAFTVTDSGGLSDTRTVQITVQPEDAQPTYVGPMLVSTECESCSNTTVPLRATIQDVFLLPEDPRYDDFPGDITHATVAFVDRENGDEILCTAPVSLLDATDLLIGTAACDWQVDIGNNDGVEYTVGVVVDGHYYRNDADDDTLVVVSKPTSNFITGGGFLIGEQSDGYFAGDPGTKTNFGLNVKFNKKLTNLKGKVTILIRHDGHVYKIKTNALSSLVVLPYDENNPSSGTAELIGKANIVDVTDPLNPIDVDGNATLHVTLKDNGEPGEFDTIGFTLWSKNDELYYSSYWDGVKTQEQTLSGGNLQVH